MSLNSARAFASSMRHDLCRILADTDGIGGIAISVEIDQFQKLVKFNPRALEHFGNDDAVYAYKKLIRASMELVQEDWPESRRIPTAFVFDLHTKWREAELAYQAIRNEDPLYEDRMGSVTHLDDKRHPPLQMADLMAHEARWEAKAFLSNSQCERPCLRQLKEKRAVYYTGLMGRDKLLAELEGGHR